MPSIYRFGSRSVNVFTREVAGTSVRLKPHRILRMGGLVTMMVKGNGSSLVTPDRED